MLSGRTALCAFACIGLRQHYERKLPHHRPELGPILYGKLLSEERLEDGYDPNREPQLESRPLISSGH